MEPAFVDWYHTQSSAVRFSVDGVPGRRVLGTVRYRRADDGRLRIELPDGNGADSIFDAIAQGASGFTLTGKFWRTAKLAALKSIYLALCVLKKEILPGERFDTVRQELLAVRNGTLRDDEESKFTRTMGFCRSDKPVQLTGVRVCTATLPDGQPHVGLMFGNDAVFSPVIDWVVPVA